MNQDIPNTVRHLFAVPGRLPPRGPGGRRAVHLAMLGYHLEEDACRRLDQCLADGDSPGEADVYALAPMFGVHLRVIGELRAAQAGLYDDARSDELAGGPSVLLPPPLPPHNNPAYDSWYEAVGEVLVADSVGIYLAEREAGAVAETAVEVAFKASIWPLFTRVTYALDRRLAS